MADPTFDHSLAAAARMSLEATASMIENNTRTRVELANKALANWTGPHARRFRKDLSGMTGQAAVAIRQLRTLAAQIDDASNRAWADGVGHPATPTGARKPV